MSYKQSHQLRRKARGLPKRNSLRVFAAAVVLAVVTTGGFAQAPGPAGTPPPGIGGPQLGGSPAGGGEQLENPALIRFLLSKVLPPLPADAPGIPAGAHNLEGSWHPADALEPRYKTSMYGGAIPLTPAGQKMLQARTDAQHAGKPMANAATYCLPPGQTFLLGLAFPVRIIQTPEVMYFIFEEFHMVWPVRMQRTHHLAEPAGFNGDSIGHWEGDTLVVETSNYRQSFWLDEHGLPASKSARITNRIRKIEKEGYLQVLTTIEDPKYYSEPWTIATRLLWRPDKFIMGEYNCESQTGDEKNAAQYGLQVEAAE